MWMIILYLWMCKVAIFISHRLLTANREECDRFKFHVWILLLSQNKYCLYYLRIASLAQSNLFCFNYRVEPFWSFYAPETGNARGTNKIIQAQKWSKKYTEQADCTNDGLSPPVMLFVCPLFGKIICENIEYNFIIQWVMQIVWF